ncbi:mechanosensitive ion channel family protein [Acidimangrovimonas sediminis]|uniref:mechanosensitive ion channel family protein n=1 Tax=Acidimangrovimonas sediminis TaxID=2056283 RepID=UPI000C800AB2|nr:mechanosensitive ion channel domain-containing protein [Acidimangrovimonas sediminis]
MEQLTPLMDSLGGLAGDLEAYGLTLLRPSQLTQVGIMIALFLVAQILRMLIAPRLHGWLRTREGWPKWRLRLVLVVLQRLRGILFVVLAWAAVGVVAEITPFPSRRYLLGVVATIATAILVVSFATRVIRNPVLRRIVTWGAWIYVTLHFLGLVQPFSTFLNDFAVDFGSFHLSALSILKALVVTGIFFAAARVLAQTAETRITHSEDISPSMRVLAVKVLQICLYGAAFFIGLKAVGFDLTGLAFLSGAVGLGLGFGLQKVVSNLVSGVIILLDKSVKPGDVISLGDTFGWIHALGARYVSVVTRDGKEYLIPNEDLITGQVVNWSHSNDFVRLDINFGTSYHDDPHRVRALAVEACASVPRVLTTRPPVCHVVGFGDSSVDYILRFWISDPTGGLTNVRGAVFLALWDAFKANDISIPFPQREVRLLDGSAVKVTRTDPAEEPPA